MFLYKINSFIIALLFQATAAQIQNDQPTPPHFPPPPLPLSISLALFSLTH